MSFSIEVEALMKAAVRMLDASERVATVVCSVFMYAMAWIRQPGMHSVINLTPLRYSISSCGVIIVPTGAGALLMTR